MTCMTAYVHNVYVYVIQSVCIYISTCFDGDVFFSPFGNDHLKPATGKWKKPGSVHGQAREFASNSFAANCICPHMLFFLQE